MRGARVAAEIIAGSVIQQVLPAVAAADGLRLVFGGCSSFDLLRFCRPDGE